MDAMEDMDLLSGSNTHLSKLSSDGNMASSAGNAAMANSAPMNVNHLPASAVAAAAAGKIMAGSGNSIFPGIKYRNIGKSGLKCSNIGLGE